MEEAIDADDVPVERIVFEYLTRIIDLVVEFNAGHEDFAYVADEEQDNDADQHHSITVMLRLRRRRACSWASE